MHALDETFFASDAVRRVLSAPEAGTASPSSSTSSPSSAAAAAAAAAATSPPPACGLLAERPLESPHRLAPAVCVSRPSGGIARPQACCWEGGGGGGGAAAGYGSRARMPPLPLPRACVLPPAGALSSQPSVLTSPVEGHRRTVDLYMSARYIYSGRTGEAPSWRRLGAVLAVPQLCHGPEAATALATPAGAAGSPGSLGCASLRQLTLEPLSAAWSSPHPGAATPQAVRCSARATTTLASSRPASSASACLQRRL